MRQEQKEPAVATAVLGISGGWERAGIAQAQLPEGDPGWSLLSPTGRRKASLALLNSRHWARVVCSMK